MPRIITGSFKTFFCNVKSKIRGQVEENRKLEEKIVWLINDLPIKQQPQYLDYFKAENGYLKIFNSPAILDKAKLTCLLRVENETIEKSLTLQVTEEFKFRF